MKVMVLIPPSKFSKNVARDLVYGCWCKGKRIGGIKFPPISQVLVASVLRDAGHEAHLVDAASAQMSVGDLQNEIAQGYGAVIILTSTMTVNEDAEILRELKSANARLAPSSTALIPPFCPSIPCNARGLI
jgi:anaerobic magnesium-protoporphyrin IX monomethyl ester cyclase